ncbi:MAG TPA: hypothetical protein VN732_03380 [Solirubrobacterales bacterium]|nr:hypothetical protein [Solirubrobacterales bacterium]
MVERETTAVKIFLGAVAAVLAVAAIGCGSGGDDTTEVVLTKTQFIKRGDAACRASQANRDKGIRAWGEENPEKAKEAGGWTAEERGQLYLTVVMPTIKDASGELSELAESIQDEKAQKIVETLESAIEEIEEEPAQVITGDPYAKANKLAEAYGFRACDLF